MAYSNSVIWRSIRNGAIFYSQDMKVKCGTPQPNQTGTNCVRGGDLELWSEKTEGSRIKLYMLIRRGRSTGRKRYTALLGSPSFFSSGILQATATVAHNLNFIRWNFVGAHQSIAFISSKILPQANYSQGLVFFFVFSFCIKSFWSRLYTLRDEVSICSPKLQNRRIWTQLALRPPTKSNLLKLCRCNKPIPVDPATFCQPYRPTLRNECGVSGPKIPLLSLKFDAHQSHPCFMQPNRLFFVPYPLSNKRRSSLLKLANVYDWYIPNLTALWRRSWQLTPDASQARIRLN
jgi:hypothetical protein